jgi:alkyl sulfatase BDS1-like metallo-beta-lactamase superfamily hydrolase
VPTRKTIVIADYFQPFLPNAGNGKRRQRYVESWARALREMVSLKPELALPMHGPAIQGLATINRRLGRQASMLESIAEQTIDSLNRGVPKYEIGKRISLPPTLAEDPDAAQLYSTPTDIAKMVAQEYSGWWNQLPSEWDGAERAQLAQEVVQLAGGLTTLMRRIDELRNSDIRLACHLVDWAWLAHPTDARVLTLATDVWLQRLRTTQIPTQEAVTYVEHLVTLRQQQDALTTQ